MRRLLLFVAVGLLLVSCSNADPAESGPDEEFLRSRLATEFPAYVRLSELRIEASQNVGDKVQPVFKTRFSATVELTADTFSSASLEDGVAIVVPQFKKGLTRDLYGLANSILTGGAWRTEFALDNNPIPMLGSPRDFINGGKVVVRGSEEEAAFRETQRATREEMARSDEARVREAEQKRIDAAQRDVERIRIESQIETERIKVQAEADAERSKAEFKVAELRRKAGAELEAERRKAAEQAAIETEQARRRDAEARVLALVLPGVSLRGTWEGRLTPGMSSGPPAVSPARMRCTSVDPAARRLSCGVQIDGSVVSYQMSGQWSADRITGSGTLARGGGDTTNCPFELTAQPSGRLEGTICAFRVSFAK